jgi:hypothetical protein
MIRKIIGGGASVVKRIGLGVSTSVLDNVVTTSSKIVTEALSSVFATRTVVYSDSEVFPMVLHWLSEHGGGINCGTHVHGKYHLNLNIKRPGNDRWFVGLDHAWRVFRYRGLNGVGRIVNTTSQNNNSGGPFGNPVSGPNEIPSIEIIIASKTKDLTQAFLDDCIKEFDEHYSNHVPVFRLQHGGWSFDDLINGRDESTVILPSHICDNLLTDIQKFISRQDWYHKMQIPYQRGYLLYGPPGTGKTSLITMVASVLHRPIYRVTFDSSHPDNFRFAMSQLPDHAILVVEDVDSAFQKEHRHNDDAYRYHAGPMSVTLSTFLNILDGMNSTSGRILFMTTNHLEVLPANLMRPGRVDQIVELGFADLDQIERLFLRFHPGAVSEAKKFASEIGAERVAMATIQELLIVSMDESPAEIVKIANGWIEKKLEDRPEVEFSQNSE